MNIFDNSFHFDDRVWYELDQVINQDYLGLKDFAITRFVPFATFTFNYSQFGLDPKGYYVFNLSVHILNAFLCYLLIKNFLQTPYLKNERISKYALIISLLGAIVFIAHPIQTQAVSYIYQRIASIATFFFFLSTLFYIKARLSQNIFKSIIYFAITITSALMGFISKENTYTLPLIIILIEIIFITNKVNIKRLFVIIIPISIFLYLFVELIYGIDRIILPQESHYGEQINSINYLYTQFFVLSKYWRLLILPYGQHLDHYIPVANSLFDLRVIFGLLINIVIIAIAIISFKKHRLLSFGFLWFYITLLVESSIIPIKDVIFEHRLYLPIFGFIITLLYVSFFIINKKYFCYIILFYITLTFVYSYLTYQRNRVWQNDGTLWTDTLRKSPLNSRAWNNLGLYFLREFKYEEAIHKFTIGIKLDPNNPDLYSNRGTAFFFQNNYTSSLEDFNKSIELNKSIPNLYLNRANIYIALKQYNKAISDLDLHLKQNPESFEAHFSLALCYRNLKQWQRSIESYRRGLDIHPNYEPAYINMAICLTILDSNHRAIETYNHAIKLFPESLDLKFRKGELLYKMKRYKESLSVLNEIKRKSPLYPKVNDLLNKLSVEMNR